MSGLNIYDALNSINWVDQNSILIQELNQAIELDCDDRVGRALIQIDDSLAFQSQLAPLLYKVITQKKINALKAILKHPKTDPNIMINEDKTALIVAVESNYLEGVDLLIKNGAVTNSLDADGWTVLDLAANFGFIEIVILLINHQKIEITKHHPIPAAALFFHPNTKEIIMILLQYGADPNAVISNPEEPNIKQTALHWLCETELEDPHENQFLLETVALLLQNQKTDPNIIGCQFNPKSPLEQAVWFEKIEIAKALLKHPNTEPNILDDDGLSILHKIAQGEISTTDDMLEVLLASDKVEVDTLSKNGETALYFAAATLDNNLATQLYNRGACPHKAREIYERLHQDQLDDEVLDLIDSLSGRLTKSAAN